VRFPRSKKKRIQKKWRMKSANWRKKPAMTAFVSKARRGPESVIRTLDYADGLHMPFTHSFIRLNRIEPPLTDGDQQN
jgi:hypothetical protein